MCLVDKDLSLKNEATDGQSLVKQFDSCSRLEKEEKPAKAPEVCFASTVRKLIHAAVWFLILSRAKRTWS